MFPQVSHSTATVPIAFDWALMKLLLVLIAPPPFTSLPSIPGREKWRGAPG